MPTTAPAVHTVRPAPDSTEQQHIEMLQRHLEILRSLNADPEVLRNIEQLLQSVRPVPPVFPANRIIREGSEPVDKK